MGKRHLQWHNFRETSLKRTLTVSGNLRCPIIRELTVFLFSLSAIRESFKKYDKKNDGFIHPDKLIKLLHRLGHNPTEDQVDGFLNEILING